MADRYWVGGSGNWSDATNHWATSSGGAPGAGNLPTASDNAIFDSASNATGYTVTINSAAVCRDLNFAAPASGNVTWAGTSTLAISGSLTMYASLVRTYTGAITFNATTTGHTITSAGVSLAGTLIFNGVGGEWTIQDAITWGICSMSNGTLLSNFDITNTSSNNFTGGTLTLGTITWTSAGNFAVTSAVTATVSGVTLIASGPNGVDLGGHTWLDVTISGGNPGIGAGTITNNLTLTGAPTIAGLSGDITVSGTFTIAGTSAVTRYFLGSTLRGVPHTITAATVDISNADLQDIIGAGAGDWDLSAITGLSGDCGGNSGIIFTTAQTNYWVGGTGSWTTAGEWASSSGGAGGSGRVPLPQDDAVFDANSFSATGQIVSGGVRLGRHIDWTGATNTPEWTTNGSSKIFGSITLIPDMILTASTQLFTMSGFGTNTITSAGHTWAKAFTFDCGPGSYTIQDAFITGGAFNLISGTFDANDNSVTSTTLVGSGTNTRTLTLGSGTWILTSTGNVLNNSVTTSLTLNAETSTIKFTNTTATARSFIGGGLTYNIFWSDAGASTASLTITGSNTFAELKDTGTAAHSILFQPLSTQTITTWSVSGSSGNLITINSQNTQTHNLVKAGAGVVSADYLSIRHSVARPWSGDSGVDTWYAGANSVDDQGIAQAGSGWIFTVPPALGKSYGFIIG